MDTYLCFAILICRCDFNYSPLAEVITLLTSLSSLKRKSTRYQFDIDLMTQAGVKRAVCSDGIGYPPFNELNNNQNMVSLSKALQISVKPQK